MTSDAMNLGATGATVEDDGKITHRDLVKSALGVGSLGMEFSWTYYKQMNIAFCLMIANMLKKIYRDDPEGYKAALERHLAFFNITVQFAPLRGRRGHLHGGTRGQGRDRPGVGERRQGGAHGPALRHR